MYLSYLEWVFFGVTVASLVGFWLMDSPAEQLRKTKQEKEDEQ
jgi:hypothetical protein